MLYTVVGVGWGDDVITNKHIWDQWENEFHMREPPGFETNMRLMEAMLEEAVEFGVFPSREPLEDIETKIRLARVLNVSGTSRKTGSGS
jgi:hypothetical protein